MTARRVFLHRMGVALGTVTAAAFAGRSAFAGQGAPAKPMAMPAAKVPAGAGLLAEVRRTTGDCVRAGEACIAHSAKELAAGNKLMAKCNASSHDMLALVRAMLTLSSADSPLARRLAPLCADACRDCAQACLEHKEHWDHGMHLECRACYESCVATEKACRALAA